MRQFIYLVSLLALFTSCRSMDFSKLNYGQIYEQRLPPLEPDFDVESFGPDYADLYNIPNVLLGGGLNPDEVVRNVTRELTIAEDTKRLFAKEVINKICSRTGKTQGYIVCRRGTRSQGIKSYWNPIVSIVTLGVANLFGFTASEFTDELEIIVDIYNLNNEVIASYAGMGYGSAKMKMYSGYSNRDAKRMAHGFAFVEALEEIKLQIQADFEALNNLLSKGTFPASTN